MSHLRLRTAFAACVLVPVLLALTLSSALADDTSGRPSWDRPVGADVVQRAAQLALRQQQAANRALMPAEIEARRASAHDFEDLSRTEAADVLADAQPTVVEQPTWPKLDLARGQELTMVSPTKATIVNPDGSRDLAVGTQPFGFPDAHGDLQPLDLELHGEGDAFVPENTPVRTVLPRRLGDPLTLGSGAEAIEVAPHGAASVSGVARDTGVFYANVDADTDLFVKPILGGVETFHVLRSADSPETVALDLGLAGGGGAHLVEDADGIALMTAAGAVAHVSAPKAVDADGRDVPVEMTLDGATLSMRVAHRGAEHAYPITVDPSVYPDADNACWQYVRDHNGCQIDLWETNYADPYGNGQGAGWSYTEADANNLIAGFYSTNTAYLGQGLWIGESGYNHFENGQGGNWSLGAPGEAVTYQAVFYNVSTDNWDNDSCAFAGIRRTDGSWETGLQFIGNCAGQTLDTVVVDCWNGGPNTCQAPANPATAQYGNRIWFGSITNPGPAFGWTHGFTHHLGGTVALMHDYVAPRSNIVDPGGLGAVQVTLGDFGLGMKRWTVNRNNDNPVLDTWTDSNCSGGTARFVCPHDHVTYVAKCGMHPGVNTIGVSATDVSGNQLNTAYAVTLDPSLSNYTTSGSLAGVNGQTIDGGIYNLHVNATDPCGIYDIAIKLDGTLIDGNNLHAPSRDLALDVQALSAGSHTLTINAHAKDQLGGGNGRWMTEQTISFTRAGYNDMRDIDLNEADVAPPSYSVRTPSGPRASDSVFNEYGIKHLPRTTMTTDNNQFAYIPLSLPWQRFLGIADQNDLAVPLPHADKLAGLAAPHRRYLVPWDAVDRTAVNGARACIGPATATGDHAVNNNEISVYRAFAPYSASAGQAADNLTTKLCDTRNRLERWSEANNGRIPRDGAGNETQVDTSGGVRIEPVIGFDHSDGYGNGYKLRKPSDAEYVNAVNAFMDQYPDVHFFTAWNEPNHANQPWSSDAAGAAHKFMLLRGICETRGCHVLAGELEDGVGATAYANYLSAYQDRLRAENGGVEYNGPWAAHFHSSVQSKTNMIAGSLTKLLILLHQTENSGWVDADGNDDGGPPIWFTEVGALTRLKIGGTEHTNRVDVNSRAWVQQSFLNIMRLANYSGRVKRIYYYQWAGDKTSANENIWDSGIVNVNGPATADVDPNRPSTEANDPTPLRWWLFKSFKQITDGFLPPRIGTGPPARSSSTTAQFTFQTDAQGVTFQCRLDGGAWENCTSPKSYTSLSAGAHSFEVQEVDAYGTPIASEGGGPAGFTSGAVQNRALTVDGQPSGQPDDSTAAWTVDLADPNTTVDSGPSGAVGTTTASFGFSGTDDVGVAGYECKVDAGAWAACTTPAAYTGLAAGSHTFSVRAKDAAGKVDGTPATRTWTVDLTAPDTTITTPPSSPTASTTASIAFTGSDAVGVGSFECQLDVGAWTACTSPKALSGLASGSHTFKARATDTAGNVDATPAQVTWSVDATAPDTTIASPPSGSTSATSASLAFSGTDNVAVTGYECQLDAGSWATCASPKAYTSLAEGSHTFKVRAKDAVGNVDASPATATWTVDTTAPDTSLSGAPTGTTAATTASISFTGTDAVGVASFECQLDGGAWAACTSPKALSGLVAGAHTFKVRAKDAAGNVDASPASATWTVSAPAGAVLMGNQSIESFVDSNSAGDAEAFPFTATATGSAASMSMYLDSSSTGAISLGLYTTLSGGRPGVKLASGTLGSPTAGAWNTVQLDGRPVVTSGTSYQVVLLSPSGGVRFRDKAGGGCTSRTVPGGALPQRWPEQDAGVWDSCTPSWYVNGGTADATAPDTTISSQPAASTTSTQASLAFGGTDDYSVSSYECRIDGGSWVACRSPRGYAGLAIGSHTFDVRAKDAAGNSDATPASATWTISTGAPATTLLAGNTNVEAHPDPINAAQAEAWPVTAGAGGTAGTISVYLDGSTTASDLQVALYSNTSNKPGTRLAVGTTTATSTGAWTTVALNGSVSIATGTTYWLSVMSADPGLVVRDSPSGTCTAHASYNPLGAFPGTWGTDTYTGSECSPSLVLRTS